MPTKEELFSDARPGEHGDRLEALKGALQSSIDRHDKKLDGFARGVGILRGAGPGSVSAARRLDEVAERFSEITKGLSPDEQAAVAEDLEVLKSLMPDAAKDISTTVPGNLHPYDLETPAKEVVPRFTPLRNRMTRSKGQGTAVEYRRILGYTNTGMGGVADQAPFFNSETALNGGSTSGLPSFGALQLIRGQKIAYAMDVHTVSYVEMSLSDSVGYKAQFANLGFENSRQLSQMALLWAHLLGEEKAMLYARGGSSLGFTGAVSAPTATATGSATGGSIGAGTYYVKLTARAGYGESVVSTEVNTGALSGSTNSITIGVTSEPAGGLGYNLYVGTASAGETFQTTFVGNSYVLTSYATGGATPPTADSSANANAYDGYLTVLTNPSLSGYVGRVNAPLWNGTTGSGDKAFQDAFASLYASVYADPEEAWITAPVRRELTDWIRSQAGGASAYRIQVTEDSFRGGMQVGGLVTGIVNESSPTGRIVDLNVHPYMPAGCAFINSRVLPIPDSHIGETAAIREVQGYMSVDWPQIQFTWDASTYWYGTMVHYAPKWSGALVGIQ